MEAAHKVKKPPQNLVCEVRSKKKCCKRCRIEKSIFLFKDYSDWCYTCETTPIGATPTSKVWTSEECHLFMLESAKNTKI